MAHSEAVQWLLLPLSSLINLLLIIFLLVFLLNVSLLAVLVVGQVEAIVEDSQHVDIDLTRGKHLHITDLAPLQLANCMCSQISHGLSLALAGLLL